MRPLNIALLQIAPCGTLEGNLEKGTASCRKAKELGADIALFPEMWSNGYHIYNRPVEQWRAEAIPAGSEFVHAFGALAKQLGMAIAVTFLVLRPYLYPLFDLSPEAGNIATIMLMVAFSTLSVRTFNSANVVGVLRGGGDVRMASLIDLSPLWLVAIPLAALSGLVFKWGILAVQISIAMENVVKFFLGIRRLRSGAWIRDITVS